MTQPEPGDDQVFVRPFADFLREQGHGATHEQLSDGLHNLVAAVRDTGKKGTLTLKVEVKPLRPGDTSQLVVSSDVKLAAPVNEPPTSVFFADKHGNLTRDDPNQLQLPLRSVPTPDTELKEANPQ